MPSTSRAGMSVATTQTAERAYRAAEGVAEVTTRLTLGPGAELHWLPQEVILFDGAALDRRLEVEMAEDATLIVLETLVLGRAAMGETVRRLHLRDRRRVSRAGRPEMIEGVRLDDEDLARGGPAGLDGAIAVAALTLLSPDAADRLSPLRAALPAGRPGARRRLGLGRAADRALPLRRRLRAPPCRGACRFRIDPTTPAARVADLTKDRRPR
jgi:urease accessory protein